MIETRQFTKAEYQQLMSDLLSTYAKFDQALADLRGMARDFNPGADARFDEQISICQDLRCALVEMELRSYRWIAERMPAGSEVGS